MVMRNNGFIVNRGVEPSRLKLKAKVKGCRMIQWEKLHTVNGVSCCPECGEEAEQVPGFMLGWPAWAHKIKEG